MKRQPVDYKPFRNPRILGHFPLNVNLDIDDQERPEFLHYDSFADLDNPKLVCLWSHDRMLQLASVKEKSLPVFLANGSLNIEVKPEEGNEASRVVFETKMRQELYVGISPGFIRDKAKCTTDVDGSQHLIVELSELSLCTNPVHKSSLATLNHDLDMGQLKKQMPFERKWLDELRGDYHTRIKRKVAELRREIAAGRAIVNDSERIPWSREQINDFKRDHPRFEAIARRGGYEKSTIPSL